MKTEAAQYNGRHFKGVESKCPDPAENNTTKKHVLPFEMGAIVLNMLCVVLSSPHFKHFEHCALCFSFKHGRHGCAFFLYLAGCRGDTFLAAGHGLTAHTRINLYRFFLLSLLQPLAAMGKHLAPLEQDLINRLSRKNGAGGSILSLGGGS